MTRIRCRADRIRRDNRRRIVRALLPVTALFAAAILLSALFSK